MYRLYFFILIPILFLVLLACNKKHEYPQAFIDEYLRQCVEQTDDEAYCKCVLEKIQKKYSFKMFELYGTMLYSKIKDNSEANKLIKFIKKAREQCLK